jgi:hypothetical protein
MATGFVAAPEGAEADAAQPRARSRAPSWRVVVAASAAILVAAGAALGGWWAASSGTRTTSVIAFGEVQRVELDVGNGNVEIVGGGLDEVAVQRTDHFAFDREPSEWRTQDNGVARIVSRCPSLVLGTCASDYRVTVSDNVPVDVRVSRGTILLRSYRGSATLESGTGSIGVSAFCGFVLDATTRQGSIDAATACSPERLELRSDTGDVSASVPPGRYRVNASATAGHVTVRGIQDDDASPWEIVALSNAGDVRVEGGQ